MPIFGARSDDANDGVGLVLDLDLFSHDFLISVIAPLPKPVGEDHGMIVAGNSLVGQQVAAKLHALAEISGDEAGGKDRSGYLFFFVFRGGKANLPVGIKIEALKRLALAEVLQVIVGPDGISLALGLSPDDDQLVCMRIGERREESRPDDAEDSDVGSDAERQGENGHGGEALVAEKHAYAKGDVTQQVGQGFLA